MNEPYDPLESELESLRPRGVSPDLQRRIAERLAATHPERARLSWSPALAGALAAACLAAVLFGWSGRDSELTENDPQPPAPIVVNGNSKPTVLAYRRALAQSSGALDALLDNHAARTLPRASHDVEVRAFTRFDQLNFSTGEL